MQQQQLLGADTREDEGVGGFLGRRPSPAPPPLHMALPEAQGPPPSPPQGQPSMVLVCHKKGKVLRPEKTEDPTSIP